MECHDIIRLETTEYDMENHYSEVYREVHGIYMSSSYPASCYFISVC